MTAESVVWPRRPAGSARVVSLGSALIDLALDVPSLPERGGDVLGLRTRTSVGGGFNLAAAVARQGVRCLYAAPHGTGPYGDMVRAAMSGEGIELAAGASRSGDTGFCLAMVEPDGERTMVTMTGVEADISRTELDLIELRPGDFLSISGYDLAYPGSGPVTGEWIASVPADVMVALDPGPLVLEIPEARLRSVVLACAVVSLNQREARMVCGDREASGLDLVAAVRSALGLDAGQMLVVREGALGAVADGGPMGSGAAAARAPQVGVLDTTGAGDTHTGVLLAELARGGTGVEALTRATVAAALSVTRAGSATAPGRADIDVALNR